MIWIEWGRFLIGAACLLFGLGIFAIEMAGVFRFRYVLNRMHAAAMGDTLGIGFSFLGLMIMSGWNFTTLKLFLVILFLWFSSPVSSHLIARLEVTTNEDKEKQYRVIKLDELEKEKQKKMLKEVQETGLEKEREDAL
ncbi:MAG: cation:proton antiporter [Lachnospiraceae bacterium]|nr:monovalent cation/H(+) antiporter subunit G [Lachnospiraceae bacterium]MDY4770134.1 monovalent cation/H(+) antiporter subunit G [Lachnospiraceae bacterium]